MDTDTQKEILDLWKAINTTNRYLIELQKTVKAILDEK